MFGLYDYKLIIKNIRIYKFVVYKCLMSRKKCDKSYDKYHMLKQKRGFNWTRFSTTQII